MGRMSKEAIIKVLTDKGIPFNEGDSWEQLTKLLNDKDEMPNAVEQEAQPLIAQDAIIARNDEKMREVEQEFSNELARQQAEIMGAKLPTVNQLSKEQALEKRIRYYVTKMGEFAKGLKPAEIEFAKELLKQAGRVDEAGEVIPKWDLNIGLPGYERF